MTLLAGFAALLHRYSGQDDLSLGTPTAGRNRSELEGLIGFFVNTLVLRLTLPGSPSFHGLVERVREAALGAFAHQELPFEKVVEELQPRRDPSRPPLFQVLFALQNRRDTAAPAAELPGLALRGIPLGAESAKFDLSLALGENEGGLVGGLEYNRDLFEAATIDRLTGHLAVLLAAAAAEPGRPLGELALLTAAEQRQLADWGTGGGLLAGAGGLTLYGMVAAQAERRPDAVALVAGEEVRTYAVLARQARSLARRLAELGVAAEEPVAVQLPRSAGLVAALLGILEAGAVYQPLDPEQPRERRAWQLRDSGATVICTSRELLAELPESPALVLLVDELLAAAVASSGGDASRRGRSTRTDLPACSTPRARPAPRTVCCWPTAASSTCCSRPPTSSSCARRAGSCSPPRSASTPRCSRSSWPSCTVRACARSAPRSGSRRRAWSSASLRRG